MARWLAVFRPSPLKTGPSEARTTPIVNGDASKFFVHFHTTFTILDPSGVGGYVERQDWARRTGPGARRSRTGGGCAAGTAGRWQARRVKAGALRRHGVSRGLWCTTPARAGVVEGLAPGGQPTPGSPRVARWCHRGSPSRGAPARGEEGEPVGWVALVGGARAAASGASRGN